VKNALLAITSDVIAVPLVEVNLNSTLCPGIFLCGLVNTLPEDIALLVGNDLCSGECIADVNVVTRSMTAAQSAIVDKPSAQNSDEQNVFAEISEPTEENFPSENILQDVASVFDENPASVIESINQ